MVFYDKKLVSHWLVPCIVQGALETFQVGQKDIKIQKFIKRGFEFENLLNYCHNLAPFSIMLHGIWIENCRLDFQKIQPIILEGILLYYCRTTTTKAVEQLQWSSQKNGKVMSREKFCRAIEAWRDLVKNTSSLNVTFHSRLSVLWQVFFLVLEALCIVGITLCTEKRAPTALRKGRKVLRDKTTE